MSTPLATQSADLPHSQPTAVSAPVWSGCRAGELSFQRCTACRAATFPPSEVCRACLDGPLVWERSAGRARLYSWTVVWRPVTPAFATPYAPAIVRLDEGYDMVTNVINTTVEQLAVDLQVSVVFRRVGEIHLPYFEPTTY
jgi:uncharacterized OB-fold protein